MSIPTLVPLHEKDSFRVLADPEGGQPLKREGDLLVSSSGRTFPVVREVPRFVSSDLYVDSFSFEWNTHSTTQLDSHREDQSSTEIFTAKTGLTENDVRGKLVLDAGVGAGRFTEVLSRWGAQVVAVDLSYAVEAAQKNFGHLKNVIVCQADIGNLPFAKGTFDFIVSIGVLHHTPDTRKYFSGLPRLLKPNGEIAIWLYPKEGDYLLRNAWIPFTHQIPDRLFYRFCRVLVRWAHRNPDSLALALLRRLFPFSNQGLGVENDVLDTFDGYSPRFHGIHSPEEVTQWFLDLGLVDVRGLPWNTAVRGRRPVEG